MVAKNHIIGDLMHVAIKELIKNKVDFQLRNEGNELCIRTCFVDDYDYIEICEVVNPDDHPFFAVDSRVSTECEVIVYKYETGDVVYSVNDVESLVKLLNEQIIRYLEIIEHF